MPKNNNLLNLVLALLLVVLCSSTSIASSKSNKELILNKANIVEMVIYTTKDVVDQSQHVKKAEAVGSILAKMDGFVGRHFTQSTDGKWVDLVYWESLDAAKRAADMFMTLPETQSFIEDINESDMQFFHTSVLSTITP
jgi:hypothetical protein